MIGLRGATVRQQARELAALALMLSLSHACPALADYREGGSTQPPTKQSEVAGFLSRGTISVDCPRGSGDQVWNQRGTNIQSDRPVEEALNPALVDKVIRYAVQTAYEQCPLKNGRRIEDRVGFVRFFAPQYRGDSERPLVLDAGSFDPAAVGQDTQTQAVMDANPLPQQFEVPLLRSAFFQLMGVVLLFGGFVLYPAIPLNLFGLRIGLGVVTGLVFVAAGQALIHGRSSLAIVPANLLLIGWLANLAVGAIPFLLRWQYRLTPHPAHHLVERAIESGEALDGDAFDAAVDRALGTSNATEAQVRTEQARALTARWREHEGSLRARQAVAFRAAAERHQREAEVSEAQVELKRAAVDHELAAARYAALIRKERSDG